MRFFTIVATTLLAMTPAVMAQQNPTNCLPKCYVYSRNADCPATHPAVGRIGPGCFKCCKTV